MALLIAIIFVTTAFLSVPIPTGYAHLGDAAIFICSVILPAPFSFITAALGAALADVATGYLIFAPITLVVKALMTLAFTSKSEKILCKRNRLAAFLAVIINVAGYYIGGAILYGSLAAPLADIPGNIAQGAVACAIFFPVALFLDKNKTISKIVKGNK